jgi:hypothetical protein
MCIIKKQYRAREVVDKIDRYELTREIEVVKRHRLHINNYDIYISYMALYTR